MSTLQESPTAQQTAAANEYTFTHDEGTTEIVFFPNRPGPIVQGQPAIGPELTYKGPEGSFTFFSDKIDIQNGPLGSLISVILGPIECFGGTEHFLRFSLVLPPVNMGETKRQSFQYLWSQARDHYRRSQRRRTAQIYGGSTQGAGRDCYSARLIISRKKRRRLLFICWVCVWPRTSASTE